MSEKYYQNIKSKKSKPGIDPYELLEIPRNISSLRKLNKIYKQLCLEYHPDRGGSEVTFKIMQQGIKIIQKDIIERLSYKDHDQLKQNSVNNYDKVDQDISGPNPETINFKKFDNNKFNSFYENNKIEDQDNYGYTEKDFEDIPQEESIGHCNKEKFKEEFTRRKKKYNRNNQIIVYDDVSGINDTSIKTTKIGERVTDFTDSSNKNLQCADYKKAYTEYNYLIDPENPSNRRQEHNNIHNLKSSRKNISYQMADNEVQDYTLRQRQKELEERERLDRQRQRDLHVQDRYRDLNSRFIEQFRI